MKKLILIATTFIAISTAVQAQEVQKNNPANEVPAGKKPEIHAQKMVDDLNTKVSLTEEQKPKVYAISLQKINKSHAIRTKYKDQPESKTIAHDELVAVKKEYRQALKGILTPEQFEKIKAAKADLKPEEKTEPLKELKTKEVK